MEQSELMVRRIKEGTVIDHIDEGKGLQVLDALRINGQDGSLITLAMNVPSGKSKKKDIIKVENKFLKDDDTNKIAIIASKANMPEYIVARFKKERFAETRKAKIRLSNIKIEEFTQVLKGMGKQIK